MNIYWFRWKTWLKLDILEPNTYIFNMFYLYRMWLGVYDVCKYAHM